MDHHSRAGRERSDREALLDTAELLFARHGTTGVSLREVTRAAGVRNKSAINYHFGDRDGLVRAVLARRGETLRLRRAVAFEQLVVEGRDHDPRALCRAVVEPYCALLTEGDGARSYLVIARDVLHNPAYAYEDLPELYGEQLIPELMRRLLHPLALPEPVALERVLAAISAMIGSVADRARRQLADAAHRPAADVALFTANLVDMVGAAICTPPHPDTTALAHAVTLTEAEAAASQRSTFVEAS